MPAARTDRAPALLPLASCCTLAAQTNPTPGLIPANPAPPVAGAPSRAKGQKELQVQRGAAAAPAAAATTAGGGGDGGSRGAGSSRGGSRGGGVKRPRGGGRGGGRGVAAAKRAAKRRALVLCEAVLTMW
eukprot:scaffold58254_cov19-Tisochrysis_lutea.AAC.1